MHKAQIVYSIAGLAAAVLAYWLLFPKKWRSGFLVALSVLFMSLFSVKFAAFFVFNTIVVYYAGKAMHDEKVNRSLIVKLTLIWLIGSLCVFKYSHIALNSISQLAAHFSLMPESVFTKIALPMGTSYVIFRLIHYITEVYRKNIPEHSLSDLALFVFFFPTFIAGPVDRFQRFHPQTVENETPDTSDINEGLIRIITGVVKKFVIADFLSPIIMPLLAAPQDSPRVLVFLAVYALAFQIYMDFSGYTDMALGVARLFGYRIMENFNYPLFKNNIALFWRNWHMSVYSFIRDYFFFPVFGFRASQMKIYIGIFATMMLFMVWHELSWSFVVLGVYHGAGLVIWQAFQEVKRKNVKLRKLVDSSYFNPVSIFLTFSFVSFGFIFFSFDAYTTKNIFYRIFL